MSTELVERKVELDSMSLEELRSRAQVERTWVIYACPEPDCEDPAQHSPEEGGDRRLPPQQKAGSGLTTFGLYVDSLRWAMGWIEKCNEAPLQDEENEDWREHAAALDLLKDADNPDLQPDQPPAPEEDATPRQVEGGQWVRVKTTNAEGDQSPAPKCDGSGYLHSHEQIPGSGRGSVIRACPGCAECQPTDPKGDTNA